MELVDVMILCLLLHWAHHANSQENAISEKELDRGALDPKLMEVKPSLKVPIHLAETVDLSTPGETTNLRWISPEIKGRNNAVPLNAFSIYNNYTSREEFVCRPWGICALGFMTEERGFYCYYSLRGQQLLTNNFQFLQNRKNYELLEWKSGQNGSVPDYSIKICNHNFVGRNEYGLGNVHSAMKVFFLPWEGQEYWYQEYEVLTVNRDPYHLLVFKMSYDTKKINVITHPSEELMESICMANNNSKEIVKEVYMQTKHEKLNIWEPSLSMQHMLTTNFSVKIPEIIQLRENRSGMGADVSVWSGYKYRENVSLTLDHTAAIKPGYCCRVKMVGKKTEVTMPFWAEVIKRYLNGTTHMASVVGHYMSKEMGGIKGVAGDCEPINNVTSERSKPSQAETPPGTGAASALSPWLASYIILALSLAAFGVAL
ncbi:natterin-3-like [Alosa sapidissima]|uniref:natterin-3-like n=1 Tax=Alosa sapidissima TaxID=34773 RepID=UPI001C093D49|nr:natterin-3-like [Alosa sapidissima]